MRVNKYSDTPIFHFFNANPKQRNVSDCVVRAVSVALGKSWETAMREMTEEAIKHSCTFNENKGIESYLKSQGWVKYPEPRDINNCKITVSQFLKRIGSNKGTIIANVGSHHVSLIKEGVVWDTWDCTRKTMHSYWRKG